MQEEGNVHATKMCPFTGREGSKWWDTSRASAGYKTEVQAMLNLTRANGDWLS